MTQIVRKFLLLSIILVIILTIILYFINQKKIENFGIREVNGRRNKYMRKCIGTSVNGLNTERQDCLNEAFQNVDVRNKISKGLDVTDISTEKIMSHIVNQIPNWSKKNIKIHEIFDDTPIEISSKKINLDTFHSKFKNPLNLSKYELEFKKILKDDLKKLSLMYNNLNDEEKKNFKKLLFKDGFIAIKVNINNEEIVILPRLEFFKKNITIKPDDNDELLIHINTNTKKSKKSKKDDFILHNISVERVNDEVDITDISLDIGLFNLGDNGQFIKIKNIKLLN